MAENVRVHTRQDLMVKWNDLFDAHPWLEGMASDSLCEDVFCCPSNPPNWSALADAGDLLFLLGGPSHVSRLSRSLIS